MSEPIEQIIRTIHVIRGGKVILDSDLAALYGVETRVLNQAVRRNSERFPDDFAFQLTPEEFDNLRSQIVSSSSWGGRRYPPFAFTEYGALMAANVLNSPRAVQMSVFIVRAFVKLREAALMNAQMARKIAQLEQRVGEHDKAIVEIIRELRRLLEVPKPHHPKKRIGFTAKEEEQ
ncbi:MAG TPA: ORF6N domain-containing protein [Candidatus Sumerlaeota bacterium]|nr:ORF6N domain-containing protein [Candidatus Sumerlaeota bacterium]